MNLKRLTILIIMCVCFLISVSCTFAADSNQISGNVTVDGQNYGINIDNFDVGEVDNNVSGMLVNAQVNFGDSIQNNIVGIGQSNGDVPGSYDDLKGDIESLHSGDVYNVTRDYKFCGDGQTLILENRIIEISQDNIVLNETVLQLMLAVLRTLQYLKFLEIMR